MTYITSKITFKVFNMQGQDVTDTKSWYIGADGTLFFETNDIDCPLQEADAYYYDIVEIRREVKWK